MNPYPAPELNDGYFKIGTDVFPITDISSGNTALQDGDKVIYYLLAFNEAVINRIVGNRFQEVCAAYNITSGDNTFTGTAIGSTYPLNIIPYLMDNGIAFPTLCMWRGKGNFNEKDISTHQWKSELNLLYILPPLKLSHIEQIKPLFEDTFKALCHKNEYGHDIGYNDGYSVAPLAGYSALGVVSYDHYQIGDIPGMKSNLPFEAFHIKMMLEEINTPIVPSVYPAASFNGVLEYPQGDPLITLGTNGT
jgi:hypothetical protein